MAVVNAIAHRDYRSTANVQIYIFHDRLEIVTPGGLPAGMREEDLGVKSVPRNPLLFGMFYRMGMVERVGSGIKRIRQMCRDFGVDEPVFEVSVSWMTTAFLRPAAHDRDQDTPQDTPQVIRLLEVCDGEQFREELQQRIGLADRKNFRSVYLASCPGFRTC